MHKICEIPSWHGTSVPKANIALIILSKQLHTHHSEYEDDDTQHKGQV